VGDRTFPRIKVSGTRTKYRPQHKFLERSQLFPRSATVNQPGSSSLGELLFVLDLGKEDTAFHFGGETIVVRLPINLGHVSMISTECGSWKLTRTEAKIYYSISRGDRETVTSIVVLASGNFEPLI
jgi:hypothetical protein